MKRIFIVIVAILIFISPVMAVDVESFRFMDHLLSMTQPRPPEIFEDAVIFSAPSRFRSVGIAFAHEGFSKVHWYKKLMTSRDVQEPPEVAQRADKDKPKKPLPPTFQDSGILFFVYPVPRGIRDLQYRLIIDGLWTADPWNQSNHVDSASGIVLSSIQLPPIPVAPSTYDAPPGTLRFSFSADPGQQVTVAGNFNDWDPFMYELNEESPGEYVLTLPLPPGTYKYIFYYHGQKILDPHNPKKIYSSNGDAVSEATVR